MMGVERQLQANYYQCAPLTVSGDLCGIDALEGFHIPQLGQRFIVQVMLDSSCMHVSGFGYVRT